MDDEELAYWGKVGRLLTRDVTHLNPLGPASDMINLWNAFGALEEKVRNAQ